jgi:cell division protein FtsQ
MLTPGVRLALRAGVPFALTLAVGTWYLSQESTQAWIQDTITETRASIAERPEFMVEKLAIHGADPKLDTAMRETLALDLPQSSFDLDLEGIRMQLAEMGPVKSVTTRIRPGGILQVDVTPRVPVVIWRMPEGLVLLDDTGAVVGPLAYRAARPDLPVIAGEQADEALTEALALHKAARPLGKRLRGLVRQGERRWDLVLDRGQRILLPEEGAVAALERMIALDTASDLLSRDIARIDLRLGQRPTIKMQPRAVEERWRIRQLNYPTE